MQTTGRHTIFANYTEKELLTGNEEQIKSKIMDIVMNSIDLHNTNEQESIYLIDYLYGDQDIKDKQKFTRQEINNKSVENWAWASQDWKKTYLLGKPIQYAPISDIAENEIVELNKYNTYVDKQSLDMDSYEDIFTCGRSFRYVMGSEVTEDDEAPYDLTNADVWNTEVVYSSAIGHEQLLSYIKTDKKFIVQTVNPTTGEKEYQDKYYDEYTIYTRNKKYVINNKNGNFDFIPELEARIISGEHTISEYYFNKKRMSYLEFIKDILNDLNQIQNQDLDDIVQNVNSIMVFNNAEVDEESFNQIKTMGAVSISSTENKKASVEILQSKLKSIDTELYYLRKLNALHSILSVPLANNNGESKGSETGKSKLTGQGFTSASVRVEGEEQAFKKCDRKALRAILKYCKLNSKSKIKTLKITDIESKFSRDLSDNLLVKTQSLQTLASIGIPPVIRNQIVGLFSDPLSVSKLEEKYAKEKNNIENEINKINNNNNINNEVNEQTNKINSTLEKQEQNK